MASWVQFAAVSVLSVLVFLGLAVGGAGGIAAFFSHPARTALVVVTLAATAAAAFTSGNLSPGEREDRGNRWVIAALGFLGLLQAFVPAYTEREGIWVLDGDAVRWLGVALYTVGCILRLWPVFVLGNRFSGLVAIQPGHALVTTGVYRAIRHPSYLGLLVSVLGWVLAFRSGVGLILAALTVIPIVARIRSEEALLASQFPGEYEDYKARTSRLIPGVY
jgi:protein-S-isoprenylcysteine O-methyltransferase Ste14